MSTRPAVMSSADGLSRGRDVPARRNRIGSLVTCGKVEAPRLDRKGKHREGRVSVAMAALMVDFWIL